MFDIGWTEMLVVACVAIIVVGPKDLPKVLRGFGKAMRSIRGLAGDFQKQFDEAIKEADLDDVKKVASGKGFAPLDDIKKSVTDFEKDVKEQMDAKVKAMDDAMEAEAVGLPEPVAKKLAEMDAKSDAAASAKTSTKSTAKKPAQKTGTKKPAQPKQTANSKGGTAKTRTAKSPSKAGGSAASKAAAAKLPKSTTKPAAEKAAPRKTAKST